MTARSLTLALILTLAAGASSAQAATTAVSSVSMSGRDAATGSAANSAGAVGTTTGGSTIDWTVNYQNLTGALAGMDLRDIIPTNQTYIPGSLKLPPGLAGRWSVNGGGTYSATEQALGVNAVRSVGSTINGSTGGQVIVQPDPSGGFAAGAVGGDGWEPLFLGDNIYNFHHHTRPGIDTMVDCHSKRTGVRCPGFGANGTFAAQGAGTGLGQGVDTLTTAAANNGVADIATNRLYGPAGVNNGTSIGVICVDVVLLASCGYTQLGTAPFPNNNFSQIFGGGLIGSNYYLMDANGSYYCFDISNQTACPGFPLPGPPLASGPDLTSAFHSQLEVFDDRYVFGNLREANNNRDLLCLDTLTNTACGPNFPIIGYGGIFGAGGAYNLPMAPILSPTGALTGICGESATSLNASAWSCRAVPSGAVVTPPPWTTLPNTITNWAGYGSIERVGTKLYFAQTNAAAHATYTCWDFALAPAGTGAACDGFAPATTGVPVEAYTIRQDPFAPDCIWQVGNAGIFEVFSATFGGTDCEGTNSAVAVAPAASYCDGSPNHAKSWSTIVITGIGAGDYNGAALTLRGVDGTIVPGWENRVFGTAPADRLIDISGIDLSDNTASLSITVSFDDLAAGRTATVTATFEGDPVQVCFKTRVAPAQCSATPPATNQATVVTTVPGGGTTDAPAGNASGVVTFQVANDPSLCPPPPPPPPGPAADLQVLKRVDRTVVDGNDPVTWTVTIANRGPSPARGLTAIDEPSLPVEFLLVRPSVGTCTQRAPVTCELGTLPAGATAIVTLIVRPRVAGTLTNTVKVDSDQPDPTPNNNVASARTTVRATPELRLSKFADKFSVRAGGRVSYTLRVSNPSPVAVQRVRVCDPIPSGLAFVSSTPRATRSGGRYCWDLQTIAAGAAKSIRLRTSVLRGTRGIRRNTATLSGRGISSKTASDRISVRGAGAAGVRGGGVTG